VKVAGCLGAARLQDGKWKSERKGGCWGTSQGQAAEKGADGRASARAVRKSVTFGYGEK
jgi:hypothetical protein